MPIPSKGSCTPKAAADPPSTFAVEHYNNLAASYVRVIDFPEACMGDVTFQVGDQLFGGFRKVLGMRCAVLERMLLGDFSEARSERAPIHLAEFDSMPRAFRQFLFYMHVGRCSLANVSDVIGLYEVSAYFGVQDLTDVCADFLDKVEITDDICVELCNFAMKYDMHALTERVVNHIAEHADMALGDPARAAQLPSLFLRYLFQSCDIAVSEVTLVRVLLELGPPHQQALTTLIRLPRIPALDMMKIVVPSGLFCQQQCLAALAFRENPLSVELPEEARAPRAASRLRPRRTSRGREPLGPWGRDFLRLLREERGGPHEEQEAEEPPPEDQEEQFALMAREFTSWEQLERDRRPCQEEGPAAAEERGAGAGHISVIEW